MEVTDSDKRSSLLWYGVNYDRKCFIYRRLGAPPMFYTVDEMSTAGSGANKWLIGSHL